MIMLIARRLQEAFVFENPYTAFTMETLRVAWEQLISSIRYACNEFENQILTRDSRGLSSEQIEDIRRSFNHFDKDGSRKLSPNEFKACLVALGYNITDDSRTVRLLFVYAV
ncbi:unnamed protein product [Protopolystoma xenopodis]|uniref:EF-hand domain-containing protein n=1 Tax=Protopolystoma xenopodis TaxID=117903 RepID=A0A3S5AQX1_9PLAT|nr:unnamed protein product [Protopolystoma xenopodis]